MTILPDPSDAVQSKTCTRCGESKPVDDFYVKIKATGRRLSRCKPCHNAETLATFHRKYAIDPEPFKRASREYIAANPEKVRATKKRYLADEANRDKVRAAERAYKAANPEKLKAKRKRYAEKNGHVVKAWNAQDYQRNVMRIRARGKAWRDANPEALKAIATRAKHKRRAAKAGGGGSFTAAEWDAIKAAHNYRCLLCGLYEPMIRLTVDHIIPLSKGGTSNADNLQPLCKSCNSSKHANTIDLRPEPRPCHRSPSPSATTRTRKSTG